MNAVMVPIVTDQADRLIVIYHRQPKAFQNRGRMVKTHHQHSILVITAPILIHPMKITHQMQMVHSMQIIHQTQMLRQATPVRLIVNQMMKRKKRLKKNAKIP